MNPFTLVVFFAPPAVISIFTLIALCMLVSEHQAKVTHNNQGEPATHRAEIRFVLVVKRNLKMLVLISGTLWLTIIPSFVIRSVIFSAGITWEDTDGRSSTPMFVLAKHRLDDDDCTLKRYQSYYILIPFARAEERGSQITRIEDNEMGKSTVADYCNYNRGVRINICATHLTGSQLFFYGHLYSSHFTWIPPLRDHIFCFFRFVFSQIVHSF